jgi:hypothetical protein
MSLIFCPSDILIMITVFLDNKSNTRLIRSCKLLKNHCNEYGFLTTINHNLTMDMMKFTRLFSTHSNTLKSVYLRGVDDGHLWLPFYPERIILDNCVITKYINPGVQPQVKALKITDYHRFESNTVVKINWDCFPNLEILLLHVYDFDRTGLNLSQLKTCKIDTFKDNITWFTLSFP